MSLPCKEDILSNLLNKMLDSRIQILEKKSFNFIETIENCNKIVKDINKIEFVLNKEVNSQIIHNEDKGLSIQILDRKSKFKVSTPIRSVRQAASKEKSKYLESSARKENKSSKKLGSIIKLKESYLISSATKSKIKQLSKDKTFQIETDIKEDVIDVVLNQMKASHTLKSLGRNKSSKKIFLGKLVKPPPLNFDDKRSNNHWMKSPKVKKTKTFPFTTKSAQIPKKKKSKKASLEFSGNKSKPNIEKNNKKNDMKRTDSNLDSKSFLKTNLTTNKSTYSTEYNSNPTIARQVTKSNTNINKILEINDFQINEINNFKTTENMCNTKLQDISHILIDNKDTIDEYINTNHFDLLTEESDRGNNLVMNKDYNELFITYDNNFNKIEYDDILEDCWLNLTKFLNDFDIISFLALNKKYFKTTLIILTSRFNERIKTTEDNMLKLKEKYKGELSKRTNFVIAKNTLRAIQLLNEVNYQNIFNQTIVPVSDIVFAYRVYFQLLGIDYSYLNDKEFFTECCKYFKSKKHIGNTINDSVKNFIFSEKNLMKIAKLVRNKEKNFSPSYYSSKCVTTGLLIFLLKDVLEYAGILKDKKNNPNLVYSTIKFHSEKYKEVLARLKKLETNSSNW